MSAPTQPLSHHEILGLVEPFTRRARRLDLAASNRLERRLVFKPVQHAAADGLPALRETLTLENPRDGTYRLTRVLTLMKGEGGLQDGVEAHLQIDGEWPADLLAQIEAVPPQRQFSLEPGFQLALSHRLDVVPAGRVPAGAVAQISAWRLVLVRAVVDLLQFDGLLLKLRVPAVTGIPGEIELLAQTAAACTLPEDLLAVQGHDWSRLRTRGAGWAGSLRLSGSGARRSADAEAKLLLTARHLVRTLAEPPAVFHQRQHAARWRVTFRRGVPLLGCFLLLGAAAAVPKLELASDSVFRMLIFNAPPLLLVAFFSLREMPQIEIPPWPRPLKDEAWFSAAPPARQSALPTITTDP